MPAPPIEKLYTHRLTPEFRRALDQALAYLDGGDEPLLAVVSSTFYAVEIIRRTHRPVHLAFTAPLERPGWLFEARAWAWGPVDLVYLESPTRYPALVWVEPEKPEARSTAAALQRKAVAQARLSVVASTALRGFLPDWRNFSQPAREPLGTGGLNRLLRSTGWRVEKRTGYHSPRAVLWTNLMRLFEKLDRPDWADRARFGMYNAYQEKGWRWKLTPLVLINASLR